MNPNRYTTLFGIIRRDLWPPDGKPPDGWDERREGSVLKRLLIHRSISQVEVAIMGLARIRDGGQVDWLKPGSKVTCRALYNSRSGVSQMFELATAMYWHKAKQPKKRHDPDIGDILFAAIEHSGRYREYLKSPEWRKRREGVLQRAGYRCERCGAYREGVEVHHLRYTSLGFEPDDDLQVLCRKCHRTADDERRGVVGKIA